MNSNNSIPVQDLHIYHPKIRAEDWRSPLVRRISGTDKYSDGHVSVNNSYRSQSMSITQTTLMLSWCGLRDDHNRCINTYQAPVITEFASLGLACILLTHHVGEEITEVTRRGQKADYWIGDKDLLIEISGQQSGNLEALRDEKADQLLDNPFCKTGYVCVANYDSDQSVLWYYTRE